ncbi:cAMP-independent regulatory protein pac2 [Ceratobasidium sp. AG-Ba]|nr:cAMP-independent regulatory protein pac2 [Ceratobasidium sp. AG-Ba]
MALPTLQGTTVNSISSALAIFYAVYIGILQKMERRLDVDERESLRSGDVYVWEERDFQSEGSEGIERWTDGIKWGSSRVRNEFLFYYERDYDPKEPQSIQDARLIKQTYSVFVQTPGDPRNRTRKWHMVAYYSQSTVEGLRKVEDVPQLAALEPPDGLFRAARVKRGQGRTRGSSSDPPSPTTGSSLRRSVSAVESSSHQSQSRSPPRPRPRTASIGHRTGSGSTVPYTRPSLGDRSITSDTYQSVGLRNRSPSSTPDYSFERETHAMQSESSPLPRLSELDISNTTPRHSPTSPPGPNSSTGPDFSRVLPMPSMSYSTGIRGVADHKALSALQKQFMK